jgi:anti-anti-sigma factor
MILDALPWFDDSIKSNMQPDTELVVLNMSSISEISSSGIGKLLGLKKSLEASGKRLALVELSPVAAYVLELARLDDMFAIFKEESSALKLTK